MKHGWIIYTIWVFLLILSGCEKNDYRQYGNEVTIEGTACTGYISEEDDNISRITNSPFRNGSEILFFSHGAFDADNQVLRYDGAIWQPEKDFRWDLSSDKVDIAAYYPVLSSSTDLYDNKGHLKDILYSNQTYSYNSVLSLSFRHLFSEILFRLAEPINSQLQSLEYKVSKKVSRLDFVTSQFQLADNTSDYVPLALSADGDYTIIIPPSESEITIDLKFTMKDGQEKNVSCAKAFHGGTLYLCNVVDQAPGIYTPDDFITFIRLYNGEKIEGRSLSEFGSKEAEGMVYRLHNSLYFTPAQSEQLKVIGFYESHEKVSSFTDIFDGMNHTLSGIELNTDLPSFALFASNEGIIRNLVLDNMKFTDVNKKGGYGAFLCARNVGQIYNCFVKNSSMTTANKNMSALVGVNISSGKVYNCGIEKCRMYHFDKLLVHSAGLVYYNMGSLFNSYVYILDIERGSLLCFINERYIGNCYTYTLSKEIHVDAICNTNINPFSTIVNVYFQSGFNKGISTDKTSVTKVIKYDSRTFKTVGGTSNDYLWKGLNLWLEDNKSDLTRYCTYRWMPEIETDRPIIDIIDGR